MKVEVCYSPGPHQIERVCLDVPVGTLVSSALEMAYPDWAALKNLQGLQSLSVAVWGRAVGWDYALRAGDRVELVRELRVDPMTARRERFAKQGAKKAGLFKTRRAGAEAGY